MNYNSSNYSVQVILLKEGTYFLGQVVFSDTYFYLATDNIKGVNIESYEDDLTPELSAEFLRIAKNLRIEQIQKEDDINLITAFSYPVGSGYTYSIARSQFSYYNSMILFKDNFSYPFEYVGNDGASVIFENSVDIDTFVGAALTKHQEIYNNRYLVSVNAINQVTIITTLKDAITEVMNINY